MDRVAGGELHAELGQIELGDAAECADGACGIADVHFLDPDRERDVGGAGRHLKPSAAQRGHRAGAGIFDVDDRDAGDPGVLEHHLAAHAFLPCKQAAERIADVSNINFGGLDASVIERTPDRRIGQRLERLVQKLPSGMGANADDGNVAHQRAAPFAGTYL